MIDMILKAIRPWPRHPIDRLYGIETSKRVRRFALRTGDRTADLSNVGYVGSQPSIVRACLELLPTLTGATFIDLGCGKGRILSVASEYPFGSIIGIELSPRVARAAARNSAHIAEHHPERSPIRILNADASQPPLPETGVAVLFLYNPFHGDMTARLIDHLELTLEQRPDLKVFVICYNPVQAPLFDQSRPFSRYYAGMHRFSNEERETSPFGNDHDSVVIWQSRTGAMAPAHPGADRRVEVTIPDLAATVHCEANGSERMGGDQTKI
jgi:SAM-dependent methyltransferase